MGSSAATCIHLPRWFFKKETKRRAFCVSLDRTKVSPDSARNENSIGSTPDVKPTTFVLLQSLLLHF
eukprot:1092124-Prorocentrum_minimum.AAC.1